VARAAPGLGEHPLAGCGIGGASAHGDGRPEQRGDAGEREQGGERGSSTSPGWGAVPHHFTVSAGGWPALE
jgi:hypothetical protein